MDRHIKVQNKPPPPISSIKGKCLHLGCGNIFLKSTKNQEWVNLDVIDHPKVNIRWDLDKYPYPFKDDSFDYIYGRCIAEHVQFFDKFVEELHRILKPGGILDLTLPFETSTCVNGHYQHKRAANSRRFGGSEGLFKVEKTRLFFGKGFNVQNWLLEPIFNEMIYFYEETPLRFLFPAYTIQFIVRKKRNR